MNWTKRQQRILFWSQVCIYYTLHEVVYGLLGFRFFFDTTIVIFAEAIIYFLLLTFVQKSIRTKIERNYDWQDNPLKRLAVQSLFFSIVGCGMVLMVRTGINYLQWLFNGFLFVSVQSLVIDFTLFAITTETIVLIEFGRYLLHKWNTSRVEMATFQKEKAQFNLELLRTQINPHFLFNNLNTLSALIYTDQDKAAAFLRKLSGVYRSILEYRNKEDISVREELLFFEQYSALLEIRFDNMLFFSVKVKEDILDRKIIPLTLQMLIENAIKHNILSQQHPLTITITNNSEYIWVANNYQPKPTPEYSSGLGLKMIESRYGYLTKLPVIIEPTPTQFLVKIPLINNE